MTVPNPGAFAAHAQPQLSTRDPAHPGVRPVGKPPLTRAAAHRARLAGGVGGGLAWLGLTIASVCGTLLALAIGAAAVLLGVVLAFSGGAPEAREQVWPELLRWLGSPTAIALIVGVPLGLVLALLGLWLSARMLRHPEIARPVAVTWAAFGISLVAPLVGGIGGTVVSPLLAAVPMPAGLPLPAGEIGDPELAALDRLVGFALPYAIVFGVAALLVQIAVSVVVWWWMAHAMRPAAPAPAHGSASP